MSSQIHISRLSSLRLFYRHNLSSAPVWLKFYLLLRMQMLVLYAITRCMLHSCCCCLSWCRGLRLLSAMTYDTKILLASSQHLGLNTAPGVIPEAAWLRRRRSGGDEERGRFLRSEACLVLGSFTSQLAFLHWAFVSSHASDERQKRQLLHWLQETTSPCGTSPWRTRAAAECQCGCAPVSELRWQLRAPGSYSWGAGSCQNSLLQWGGSMEKKQLGEGISVTCLEMHLAETSGSTLVWACHASLLDEGRQAPRKRLGYSRWAPRSGEVWYSSPPTCLWSSSTVVSAAWSQCRLCQQSCIFCRRGQRADCRRPHRLCVFIHWMPRDILNSPLSDKNSTSGSWCGAAKSCSWCNSVCFQREM